MNGSRMCFFAENHLGIGTAAAAIKPYICAHPETRWVDVTYQYGLSVPGRFRRLQVRGALAGFLQTGSALRGESYNALGFLTHNPAVLRQLTMTRIPTLLWTDVTPALLDSQAEAYDHRVNGSRATRAVKHALVRRAFQKARLCVGWSEWARRSFVQDYGVPESRTHVVPPGIDLTRWPNGPRLHRESPPRLLFVGGHFARKGGELLLDVFRKGIRGRATLDVVTRDAVPDEPGVRVHRGLLPDSAELKRLYREADVFVLPTTGDCFSIASLEAMAMGLPVVVSAVGGIPDIVEHHESGLLIGPGNGTELAKAIHTLLADRPRAIEMGLQGRAMVEARFDARVTAKRLLDLLAAIGTAQAGERQRFNSATTV